MSFIFNLRLLARILSVILSAALWVGAFPNEGVHAANPYDLAGPDSPGIGTIPLAALLPLSGQLASRGELHKFALEKGVAHANLRWQEEASPWRFRLEVVDSQSDPDTALAAAKRLWDQGYRIFIVSSSAEVERLQPWAAANDALVLSHSSTSPALSVAGNSVFRLVPTDVEQAKALANLLVYEGMLGVVPVYRNDVYGRQLTELLTEEFTQMHGLVSRPIVYEPQHSDWAEVAAGIALAVENLNLERSSIAIAFFGFDEMSELLRYSGELSDLRWFSVDNITLSPAIFDDPEVSDRAMRMQLQGVTFGLPESAQSHPVYAELAEFAGGTPLPDSLFAYDIPGLLAHIVTPLEQPLSIAELKTRMVEGSKTYVGVTGWTILNEQGDRKYFNYDIWKVGSNGQGEYFWTKTGRYVRNPGAQGYILPLDSQESDPAVEAYPVSMFGYSDEPFDVERKLTRAEFISMLMAALGYDPAVDPAGPATFIDADEIDVRARAAVAKAQQLGIVQGNGHNDFQPNREITWFEAVHAVAKALDWPLLGEGVTYEEGFDVIVPTWAQPSWHAALQQNFVNIREQSVDVMAKLRYKDAVQMVLEIRIGGM